MRTNARRESPLLFAGDICFLILALWVTLFVRYGTPPDAGTFFQHLAPFSLLFLLSALVFLMSGLYEKHTLLFKSKLPETILFSQVANIAVAAVFFFLVPYFGIQPKTNLIIYLILSTTFVSLWRLYLFPLLSVSARGSALLVGEGEECTQLYREVNHNNRYQFRFVEFFDVQGSSRSSARERILSQIESGVSIVVFPFSYLEDKTFLPEWSALVAKGTRFIDAAILYEELFDRVGLSFLDGRWFLEESARTRTIVYAFLKRAMDIAISLVALLFLSPLLFVIAAALKAGGAPAFIFQERVGRAGRIIKIVKFRTMLFDDGGDQEKQKGNRITTLGGFLRRTQIDEMPQFWNILRGDLSFVGPRPEIPALVREYERTIPFYSVRHLLQPGVSGWAQIKHASPPKFKIDVEATKAKLSYDLYYMKHRSLMTDLTVALQTVKIVLSRASR